MNIYMSHVIVYHIFLRQHDAEFYKIGRSLKLLGAQR